MGIDDTNIGSLFGKAKKWAKKLEDVKNGNTGGGGGLGGLFHTDPQSQAAAQERQDQFEREAAQARDAAIADALIPQGVKDWAAQQAADKAVRDQERSARDRADRATRAGTSTVTMSGFLNGTADQLAVSCEQNEYSGGLGVTVELVDPTYFGGPGVLRGFNFEIPGGGRDGTYELADDGNFEALNYSIDIDGDQEGWCFHPTFGPGTIVVSDGVADVSLVFGASGSERIFMHGRMQLGAR